MSHELISALLVGLAAFITALAEYRGRGVRLELDAQRESITTLRERVAKLEGKAGV